MIKTIDISTCTGCGICDAVCPADVIYMEPASSQLSAEVGLDYVQSYPVIKYVEHCITCFNCEIFCPDGCVDVHPVVKGRPRPWKSSSALEVENGDLDD